MTGVEGRLRVRYARGVVMAGGATMLWKRLGRVVVTVHAAREPTEDEWVRYVTAAVEHRGMDEQRILVLSAGGAPNPAQRRRLITNLEGATAPTAIVTNSWLVRGAGTAVSWFNPELRVFGPRALDQAMDFLRLSSGERSMCVTLVRDLQSQLGVLVVDGMGVNLTK